jgi:hypothetical protein
MKSLHWKLLGFGLLALNIFLLTRLHTAQEASDECNNSKELLEIFYQKTRTEKENENLMFPQTVKLMTIEGDTISPEKLFTTKTIVFRFSTMECSECVNNEINLIIDEMQKNPKLLGKICFLMSYTYISDVFGLSRQLNDKSLKVPIYLVPYGIQNIPLEVQNIPYYFTIDENNIMNNFLIPMKERQDWTKAYISVLLKNYFSI